MKVVLFGIGKRYHSLFINTSYWREVLDKKSIEVVAVSDKSKIDVRKTEIGFSCEYVNPQNINSILYDKILVLSGKYYYDIVRDLVQIGIKEKDILLWEDFIKEHVRNIFHVSEFVHKHGCEIGGPSALFSDIYSSCNGCDNVLFSSDNVWIKYEDDVYKWENRSLGKLIINDATNMDSIEDEKYEFVISSYNIEHIANPMRALSEFVRILCVGGLLMVVVPKKMRFLITEEISHLLNIY